MRYILVAMAVILSTTHNAAAGSDICEMLLKRVYNETARVRLSFDHEASARAAGDNDAVSRQLGYAAQTSSRYVAARDLAVAFECDADRLRLAETCGFEGKACAQLFK